MIDGAAPPLIATPPCAAFDDPCSTVCDRKQLELLVSHLQRMQLVGRIAGGIAHDFRNLLTIILGCADLLLENAPEGDPSRQDLEAILDAARRASLLTGQLLGFTKPKEPTVGPISFGPLLKGMRDMLARMAGEDIRLHIDVAPDLGTVLVDATHVEQVVANLVINARDAMPVGGDIYIAAANARIGDRDWCELTVRDTGTGMTPDILARIRSYHFTTKAHGNGLGIPTCDRIVAAAGGALEIWSTPGCGTCVSMRLPRVWAPAEAGMVHSTDPTSDPRGSETVLVVEDEHALLALFGKTLASLGYRPLLASSASEAEAIFHQVGGTVDAILCDVVLPDTNGPALASHLAAGHARPAVLFTSGHSSHALLETGALSSQQNFLQKPMTRRDLARKLRELLDAPRIAEAV